MNHKNNNIQPTKNNQTLCRPRSKIKQISQREHIMRKSMWSGSKTKQKNNLFLYNDDEKNIRIRELSYSPALYKIIDEVIVNASDHYVELNKNGGDDMVTRIDIKFDKETGEIACKNDGAGIPTEKIKTVDGRSIHTPQMVASEFQSGGNLDEDKDRITGGTNGLGFKITNVLSSQLSLETYDAVKNCHYYQLFESNLSVIREPVLKKLKKTSGFTEIKFIPDYKLLGFKDGYDADKHSDTIYSLLQHRAMEINSFIDCDVYFNNKKIIFENILSIKKQLPVFQV